MKKYTDADLENLWKELDDVPFDEDEYDMHLTEDWYIWKTGTQREEIWHWFDEHYSKGVVYLMYRI